MKKFSAILFVMICAIGFSFAQSLSLNYGTTDIDDGDTLEVVVPQLNSTADFYLDLTNVSEEDVTVRVYKNELDMLEGATAALCFGGMCYPPATSSSGTYVVPAQTTLAHPEDAAFHLSYKTTIAGVSYVEFTFANEENYDDHISVVFKLVCDPTSIISTAVATKMYAFPNPASEIVTVEYAYSGNSNNVQLVIKNLLGATLYTKKLDANGNKVKIDISEYNAGIYFYSIEADGRPLVTKKLLVK